MQTIIAFIAHLLAKISLELLMSFRALSFYGGCMLALGCMIGNVPLVLLGVAALYFGNRERDPADTQPIEPTHSDEKAEQS